MYLTEMIKALPTQSGRYLAPAVALSHVLKRQQTDPGSSTGFKERNTPKWTGRPLPSSQEVFTLPVCSSWDPCSCPEASGVHGQQDLQSPPDNHRDQCHPPAATLAQSPLAEINVYQGLATQWPGDLVFTFAHQRRQRDDLVPRVLIGKSSYPVPFQGS